VRNISSTSPAWEGRYDLGVVSLGLYSSSVPWVQCQHFLEQPTNAIWRCTCLRKTKGGSITETCSYVPGRYCGCL